MALSKAIQVLVLSFLLAPISYACTWAEAEHLLALNMYHEARGEATEGMVAVNQVVLNRVDNPTYPDTICKVVTQPSRIPSKPKKCAFSWWCDFKPDNPTRTAVIPFPQKGNPKDAWAWEEAKAIARLSLLGVYGIAVTGKPATMYIRCDKRHRAKWNWKKLKYVGKIGRHCFYAERREQKN